MIINHIKKAITLNLLLYIDDEKSLRSILDSNEQVLYSIPDNTIQTKYMDHGWRINLKTHIVDEFRDNYPIADKVILIFSNQEKNMDKVCRIWNKLSEIYGKYFFQISCEIFVSHLNYMDINRIRSKFCLDFHSNYNIYYIDNTITSDFYQNLILRGSANIST